MNNNAPIRFDADKFELIHQVGGIRTATYDWPDAGGAPGCRVAMVNTGSDLRFTVALDRGGDIVEAFFGSHSLAYLTPNGYRPPRQPLHRDEDWLAAWPAGLLTACGPRYIGPGREEDGLKLALHGQHSNTPAALLELKNPDPRRDDLDMRLGLVIRDTQMYGPVVEVRRRIACRLGEPVIRLRDEVINLGNSTVAHNWLYHVNLGYPLLDSGSQLLYGGRVNGGWQMNADMSMADLSRSDSDLQGYLAVPEPLPGARRLRLPGPDPGHRRRRRGSCPLRGRQPEARPGRGALLPGPATAPAGQLAALCPRRFLRLRPGTLQRLSLGQGPGQPSPGRPVAGTGSEPALRSRDQGAFRLDRHRWPTGGEAAAKLGSVEGFQGALAP